MYAGRVEAALLAFALASASPVLGSLSQWGQCGGTGYTGSTICASPNVCTVISSALSQCIAPDNTPLNSNPYYKYNGQIYPSTQWAYEVQAAGYDDDRGYWNPVEEVTPLWLNESSRLSALTTHLTSVTYLRGWAVPIVIYNLPDRNCATNAQPGEFTGANGGASHYSDFIQQIYTVLQSFNIPVIIILEPHSLSPLAQTLSASGPVSEACYDVLPDYLDNLANAVEILSALSTVTIYLDGGNAAMIADADARNTMASVANLIYGGASRPASIRGVATNIGSYNAFDSIVPEAIFGTNPVYNELLYAEAMAPLLEMPYFIVDTSRSGVQGIRSGLHDWCNVKNAGFGQRPVGSPIPGLRLIDALVWVKLGGESDGTSSTASPNFDSACASADSTADALEYGDFMAQYYVNLANDAVPSIL